MRPSTGKVVLAFSLKGRNNLQNAAIEKLIVVLAFSLKGRNNPVVLDTL